MYLTIKNIFLLITLVTTALAVKSKRQVLSSKQRPGLRPLRGVDLKRAETTLRNSLKLLEKDGPHYRISQVTSAREEIPVPVSGTFTELRAELIDEYNVKRHCSVEIWSRPWRLQNIQITVDCEGLSTLTKDLIM